MKTQLSGKILVVEDNIVNQKLTCAILKKIGLDFEVAGQGEEAISLWQHNAYDLILMDCQMPVMDGYIATQKIRQLETTTHTPIIALTANAMANDDIRCKNSGMDDFLSKPFTITDLISILEKWLSHPGTTTSNTDELLDLDYAAITELKESLEDGFIEIIEIYIKSTTNILEEMMLAYSTADHSEIQRLAHSLKSSSAIVGATKISNHSKNLEFQLMKNNFSNMKEKIDELNKLFILVAPKLKVVVSQTGSDNST